MDESGTHSDEYLIIGMLFVPDHGPFHSKLIKVKEARGYYNRSPKRKAQYKETHFTKFKSKRDVDVLSDWMDVFVASDAWFRCIIIDWSIWDGSHFGNPFEPSALKKRRAYKKWAELLLQPEFSSPLRGHRPIRNAQLYLDRLRITYGYDVLDALEERFTSKYEGDRPFIKSFQHTPSWKDANQALQLCDAMVGSIYQALVPSRSEVKLAARDMVASKLSPFGVDRLDLGFWRQWHPSTLRQRLPRFCAWVWVPESRRR